ncbi:3-hydroxybutyryl-CoA dehydratase [Evansella vedderi]|uniref:3-hydroxybutyryl-CoA dehydratase n=1 Tax=Evansella vedderi TaxID=38282 RepID=A0ABU0A3I2_9BACI|nr:MaoC family dehydratase [Evansella vedderi]MDQ0256915.1 3-hydroxybutyryl-CoA dehydratase [Evansella vedderi]
MVPFKIGEEASFSRTVTETDIVLFAGLSGDYNPVHVDKEYAKDTRFGQRIAHGILTTTFLSRLLGMELPGPGAIYLDQTLKFKKPVFIGDTITAKAIITEVDENRRILTLSTICTNQENKVVLEGSGRMMVPEEGGKI